MVFIPHKRNSTVLNDNDGNCFNNGQFILVWETRLDQPDHLGKKSL